MFIPLNRKESQELVSINLNSSSIKVLTAKQYQSLFLNFHQIRLVQNLPNPVI